MPVRPAPSGDVAQATRPSGSDFVAVVRERLALELGGLAERWDEQVAALAPAVAPIELHLPDLISSLDASGGKHLRSYAVSLGWASTGRGDDDPRYRNAVQAGVALELLHLFALVHDDVMDRSRHRRGRPSVHEEVRGRHEAAGARGDGAHFGHCVAVLVGDLAHAEADHLAATLPEAVRLVWQRLTLELVAGQLWDLTGTAGGRHDLGFARTVARQKSGAYTIARPLELGATAAGGGPETLRALATYGRHAGEAFALRDDLLGVFGDPGLTGKPAGDDLSSGKPTVLLALAEQRLPGDARGLLDRVGTPAMSELEARRLRSAMVDAGIPDEVESMITDRVAEALAALDADAIEADAVAGLTGLAHQLAWRGR